MKIAQADKIVWIKKQKQYVEEIFWTCDLGQSKMVKKKLLSLDFLNFLTISEDQLYGSN